MREDLKRWDEKYRESEFHPDQEPSTILKKYVRLFPKGRALDIAAGEGRNAVFLAEHGLAVDAVDISRVALNRARKLARARGVRIRTIVADLDRYPIPGDFYDLIIDFNFLDRRLISGIKKGLKSGGIIMFETYLAGQRSFGLDRPSNPKYLLEPNELLRLFRDFRILFFREGVFKEGGSRRAIASLIAQKIDPRRRALRGVEEKSIVTSRHRRHYP